MKKIIILTLFTIHFSLFTPCFGQFNTYHPFPDTNAAWRETTEWLVTCLDNSDGVEFSEFDYYLRGDTLANGKAYIKVNTSGGFECWDIPICFPHDTVWQCYNHLACLLRNDTLGKKVYVSLPPNYNSDTLLYDFTLNVGDTLPDTYNSRRLNNFYVLSIDSILVGNEYRKQFIIAFDTGNLRQVFDSIIEGIGSAEGLLEYIVPFFEGGSYSHCFVDSTITFSYPNGTSCNMFYTCPVEASVVPVEKPEESVSIFPNPSSGKFNLELSEVSNRSSVVKIYNILGEQVYSQFTMDNSQWTINLSSQPNGVYLYRVIAENGELIGEGKLLINK